MGGSAARDTKPFLLSHLAAVEQSAVRSYISHSQSPMATAALSCPALQSTHCLIPTPPSCLMTLILCSLPDMQTQPHPWTRNARNCKKCIYTVRPIQLNPLFLSWVKVSVNQSPELINNNFSVIQRADSHKAWAKYVAKCFAQGSQRVFYQITITHTLMNSVKQMALQLLSVHYAVIVRQRMATKQRLT